MILLADWANVSVRTDFREDSADGFSCRWRVLQRSVSMREVIT